MEVLIASNLDDSKWHRLSMQISEDQKLIRVEIDGHGKEIRSEEQLPTLISSSLKFLSLGQKDLGTFTGCFRRFIVNNQAQNFDASERKLLTQQVNRAKSCERNRRESDFADIRQLKAALRTPVYSPEHRYSSSECSIQEPDRRRRRRSQKRPLQLLSTPNLEPPDTTKRRHSSGSESESVTGIRVPHGLERFRAPRSMFAADSEESSVDGWLKMRENLQRLAQFSHYV
ncbi:unnamed protein product [Gongylonema pulchrum]|uniref:LAM_G_DOMAIN domain-containing protein n=1 Tax=Gongylonema pulchrum TaxID=637853 RepID=A0A183EHV3_9BILA|nr:unnamed protein product [Gongylonema pulchrum]